MRVKCHLCAVLCLMVFLGAIPRGALAQAGVDENVVFGMYSGLSLLMDVHYPESPNGYGIVFIYGSGFHTTPDWEELPLKDSDFPHYPLRALVDGGYTVFVPNHRAAPTFRYPANIEDAQRAVRFVREHAADFGISPDRIGAFGGSSGGHLSNMLGLMDGDGDYRDKDVGDITSAKVQAVVSLYSVSDLWGRNVSTIGSYMGVPMPSDRSAERDWAQMYDEASPVSYVSEDDPPFLLIHGDADAVVPYEQSVQLHSLLKQVGVTSELLTIPGGGHGASILVGDDPYHFHRAVVAWFDKYLRAQD